MSLINNKTKNIPLFEIDFERKFSTILSIKSTLKIVNITLDLIKNKVINYNRDKAWQIETVLHEALVNSIEYGNNNDETKEIKFYYEIGNKALRVIIEDEGIGFDVNNVSVPIGKEALEKINGRGIYMMMKFSEALFYNTKGNKILLFFSL